MLSATSLTDLMKCRIFFGIILLVFGGMVILSYCSLFISFKIFIARNIEYRSLNQTINPFFIFMIFILFVKEVLNIVYQFRHDSLSELPSKIEFYTNIGIEIIFNLLLIYYQIQFSKNVDCVNDTEDLEESLVQVSGNNGSDELLSPEFPNQSSGELFCFIDRKS